MHLIKLMTLPRLSGDISLVDVRKMPDGTVHFAGIRIGDKKIHHLLAFFRRAGDLSNDGLHLLPPENIPPALLEQFNDFRPRLGDPAVFDHQLGQRAVAGIQVLNDQLLVGRQDQLRQCVTEMIIAPLRQVRQQNLQMPRTDFFEHRHLRILRLERILIFCRLQNRPHICPYLGIGRFIRQRFDLRQHFRIGHPLDKPVGTRFRLHQKLIQLPVHLLQALLQGCNLLRKPFQLR